MKKLLEIIHYLRQVTEWSQPNMKFVETMALINELEEEVNTLQVAEPKEEIVEVPQEPITIEEVVTEEPVVTEEAPKKRNYHFKKKETPVE